LLGVVGCCLAGVPPTALSSTLAQPVEISPNGVLGDLVGTTWMYGGLWASNRPDPIDPATVRLRFPTEGKVEVLGPCGSEVGELQAANPQAPPGTPVVLTGTFASGAVAAECPGSPRQGIVGDLIRSGLDGSNGGMRAMFRSRGHSFFEDTETGLTPLAGTRWDVELADGAPLAPLHWTVEFGVGGQVGGSDECNGFNGFYVTKGDELRTSGVTSTAMGCTSYSNRRRLFTTPGTSHFVLFADRLIIRAQIATYVLRPKSFGLPLTGTKWKSVWRKQPVSITFLPESRARISTKCFSAEVPFNQRRANSAQYEFSFDFSSLALSPDRRKCRVGFELIDLLRNVTLRTQDSLVLRLGVGLPTVAESFQTRMTLELDSPVDRLHKLAGTRWRMTYSSPPAANDIAFLADGTLKFGGQCGSWIYRIENGGYQLDVQLKTPCKRRDLPLPFALPILHFELTGDGKTLELFNIADRRVARYIKVK
jgi:heat shock protein HslJ